MTRKINPIISEMDLGEIELWKQAREYFQKYIPTFQDSDYDQRVKPKSPNIELELKKLGIIKTEEYDKPWKSDPTKSNKAFDLQLTENPSMKFQIVKDLEDKYWSIHFKTDNPKANEEGQSYSGLNDSQKLRLFQGAALVIPEGEFLSTWGELTPGGISGLNRFGQRNFTGNLRFIKTGVRNLKTKGAKEFSFKASSTTEGENPVTGTYNAIQDDSGFWHINIDIYSKARGMNLSEMKDKGVTVEDILGSKDTWEDQDAYDKEATELAKFKVGQITLRPDGTISLIATTSTGDNYTIEGESAQKIYNILFPDININNYISRDIEVPIWQKMTGETDEEYENRNQQMEGESEEEFAKRKKERIFRLDSQTRDKELDLLQQLLDSSATIDSNTYRYIIGRLGQRVKDIKTFVLKKFGKNSPAYVRIQEVLRGLNDDFSIEMILESFTVMSMKSGLRYQPYYRNFI